MQSPADTKTIFADQNPSLAIEKTPDLQSVAVGGTATFTIAVTNTGNVTLTDVTVSDPLAPLCNRTFAILAPAQTQSYNCTVTVTSEVTNVAGVTANDPDGDPVTDSDDAVVDALPSITVTKVPDETTVAADSASVRFTIAVTNTSVEPVTLTALTDSVFGDLTLASDSTCLVPVTIAEGGSYSCNFDGPIFGQAGDVHENTVTPVAVDDEGNFATTDAGAQVTFVACAPCEGKVTEITLEYNGGEPALVKVESKKGEVLFEGYLHPDDRFTFDGIDDSGDNIVDNKGTLGPNIFIFVDGVSQERIHTSCSAPIGPGMVFGDFEVIRAYSRLGGLICAENAPPPDDPDIPLPERMRR